VRFAYLTCHRRRGGLWPDGLLMLCSRNGNWRASRRRVSERGFRYHPMLGGAVEARLRGRRL